jgi:hypothetical protein
MLLPDLYSKYLTNAHFSMFVIPSLYFSSTSSNEYSAISVVSFCIASYSWIVSNASFLKFSSAFSIS